MKSKLFKTHVNYPYRWMSLRIAKRNDKVLEKLNNLHDKCEKKKNNLNSDYEFAKFKENSNELNEWIDDKLIIIQDDNYKELFNLPEKLQKHKALEAEIKANITVIYYLTFGFLFIST